MNIRVAKKIDKNSGVAYSEGKPLRYSWFKITQAIGVIIKRNSRYYETLHIKF